MLHKKLTWDVYCTCWAHAQNLQLLFFKAEVQSNRFTRLKLREQSAFLGGTCHCGYRCWAAQKASASVGKLHKRGSSEFVKFLDSDIKLSTMAQMDRGITTLYKKLIWAAHCPCWARAQNKHLFLFFLVCMPSKWMCTIQTMWAGSCSWWACDIEVTGAEGRAHQVSEGKTLLRVECEARSEVLS